MFGPGSIACFGAEPKPPMLRPRLSMSGATFRRFGRRRRPAPTARFYRSRSSGRPASNTGTRRGSHRARSNASLTIEMDWFGNGLDDANSRTIQSLVIGQNNTAGAPVEVGSIIGVYLSGGSSGSAKTVFFIAVPFSNAVLDTTDARQINNAPVIKMSAGQAIAFEGTNSNRLLFDSTTNTLRWNQGTLSYAVGKGISVGWVNVYSSSTTLPNYISGNMIILPALPLIRSHYLRQVPSPPELGSPFPLLELAP